MSRIGSYNGFPGEQRLQALAWLKGEYKAGRRTPPTSCEACGQPSGCFQAHSEDYSGPPFGDNIGAYGLCYICHLVLHCRFTAPKPWLRYVESVVVKGLIVAHPPVASGEGWARIQRYLNGHDFTWTPAPSTFVQSGFLDGLSMTGRGATPHVLTANDV